MRDLVATLERELRTDRKLTSRITKVDAATYTVLLTDDVIWSTYTSTGAVTVTLPTAAFMRERRLIIKDGDGNASANNITINGQSGETIDGSASAVISTNYGKIEIITDGSTWITI